MIGKSKNTSSNDVVSVLGRGCRESKIRNMLEALSNEDLASLGMSRRDIAQVAQEAANQQ
jgi:hypothetical protein